MRLIKFRGKRVDNGDWVYGSYHSCTAKGTMYATEWDNGHRELLPREAQFNSHFILEHQTPDSSGWGISDTFRVVDVLPETVGQYIGLKGYKGQYERRLKNEVYLYEDDVVEAVSEGSRATFIIKFRNSGAPVWLLYPNWQNGKHWNISASDVGRATGDFYDDLKVIGNIHDNPELLNNVKS